MHKTHLVNSPLVFFSLQSHKLPSADIWSNTKSFQTSGQRLYGSWRKFCVTFCILVSKHSTYDCFRCFVSTGKFHLSCILICIMYWRKTATNVINSLSKTLKIKEKSKNIYKGYINKNKMFPCRSESVLLVDCVHKQGASL